MTKSFTDKEKIGVRTTKYEYTNVRMFNKTHRRFKLKAAKAGVSLMRLLDDLSKN
jgi:predicted HicB family RNase H-like nuclease